MALTGKKKKTAWVGPQMKNKELKEARENSNS